MVPSLLLQCDAVSHPAKQHEFIQPDKPKLRRCTQADPSDDKTLLTLPSRAQ